MKTYQSMNRQELADAKSELMKRYQKYKDMDLALNIARGNPSTQQLDMIMPMMDMINSGTDCRDMYGTDARNYGALLGLREAREYFGALLGTTVEETIVVGASSINFMYDCLARAMLKGADVVILDEASAFVDPECEAQVQLAFQEMAKGRTVIMIAHRLSTIRKADRIYVLDNGHVKEHGKHDELLEKGGLYADMWAEYQKAVNWKVGEAV